MSRRTTEIKSTSQKTRPYHLCQVDPAALGAAQMHPQAPPPAGSWPILAALPL